MGMKHFDQWQWADFVRGMADPFLASAMSDHLTQCSACGRTAGLLRAVAQTARAETQQLEPPAVVVRRANAIYAMAPPALTRLARVVLRLVHDSARAPLPLGLRGHERLSRRVLYESDGYHVDLQLERQPNSNVVTLVGQVADRIQPASCTADVPIWLMERDHLLESTLSNELGEFQMAFTARRNLRLFVPLPDAGKRLEIALSRLTPGGMRGTGRKPTMPRRRRRNGRA